MRHSNSNWGGGEEGGVVSSKEHGSPVTHLMERQLNKANNASDPSHFLYSQFQLLQSGH